MMVLALFVYYFLVTVCLLWFDTLFLSYVIALTSCVIYAMVVV